MMITAAMLKLVEEAGTDVLVLVEGVEQAELVRSRLTRSEVRHQLVLMARTLASLPPAVHAALPEIDWAGWRGVEQALATAGAAQDDALWFATQSLVPATLSWLRVYRREQPALFAFTA